MEPFILEEFLIFVVLIIAGGVVFYYVMKVGLSPKVENAQQRIARIIHDCEARLSKLNGMQKKLKTIHSVLQAAVSECRRVTSDCLLVEAEALGERVDEDRLRPVVKARLEAEAREKIATQAEDTARQALDEIVRDCDALSRRLSLAKVAQAQLEARLVAAKIKQDIHDDFGDGAGAAFEELEIAATECEARAKACEETSRFSASVDARVSDEEVMAALNSLQALRKEGGS